MNTLNLLQHFDGLAEKFKGSFSLERVSSQIAQPDYSGERITHRAHFLCPDGDYEAVGQSRKAVLKGLYRKMRRFGTA